MELLEQEECSVEHPHTHRRLQGHASCAPPLYKPLGVSDFCSTLLAQNRKSENLRAKADDIPIHMGEGDAKASSYYLPPGCRFYPSEEQLLCYYLSNKNAEQAKSGGYDLIKELDLYDHDPFNLPDYACYSYGHGGRKRHWYCYTVRVLKDRRAKSGYWKRKGRVRDVVGRGGKAVLGRRSSFEFYLGNSPKTAVRTDWVLYQYAQLDHLQVNCSSSFNLD